MSAAGKTTLELDTPAAQPPTLAALAVLSPPGESLLMPQDADIFVRDGFGGPSDPLHTVQPCRTALHARAAAFYSGSSRFQIENFVGGGVALAPQWWWPGWSGRGRWRTGSGSSGRRSVGRCGSPPHGLSSHTMAPITSDCDDFFLMSIKWT